MVAYVRGEVHALDTSTGVQKWLFQTDYNTCSSPAISHDGGTIFVGDRVSDCTHSKPLHSTTGSTDLVMMMFIGSRQEA